MKEPAPNQLMDAGSFIKQNACQLFNYRLLSSVIGWPIEDYAER